MILRSANHNNDLVYFFDAKIIKNAVLSALDLKQTLNVWHFVPKVADSTALFSGIGVFA